jgi:hypothetical protein
MEWLCTLDIGLLCAAERHGSWSLHIINGIKNTRLKVDSVSYLSSSSSSSSSKP